MKKIILFASLFIAVGVLPCKAQQDESYMVSFSFPGGQTNATVVNFLTEYALQEIGGDELSRYSDVVAQLGEAFIRELYGGLPVSGTLTFYNNGVQFVPGFGSGLFVRNCKMMRIPFSDITDAVRETRYVAYQFVKIITVNGIFRFQVVPSYVGATSGQDICNYILRKIGRQTGTQNFPGKYPEVSQRLLNEDDLSGKSAYQLKIMRNEVYARYGYIFKTPQLREYFNNQSWYKGQYRNVDDQLSAIERTNVEFILAHENR
jgi:hypothetical protein